MTYIDNSISILDTRFPQPGRYKDYGVPDAVADQADALFRERNVCQNERVKEIDAELRWLLGDYIREYIYPRGIFRSLQWVRPIHRR